MKQGRPTRDADYVLDLCDEILGESSHREHRFSWLRGDPDARGKSRTLPVDAYYPAPRVVMEYRERQHDESLPFFDKPDWVTVSGVDRGQQRRICDERRDREIPVHGLKLLVIRPADLDAKATGRLRENKGTDMPALRSLLRTVQEPPRGAAK